MTYGGMSTHADATLLTEKALKYLEKGPADVVDLIGHICNLGAAPRIVAEHMAHAMFAGRPEFALDANGRWTFRPAETGYDGGAGERPEAVREPAPPVYGRRGKRRRNDFADPSLP